MPVAETGTEYNPDHTRPVDRPRIEAAVREILDAIGEDLNRDGLRGTPERVAKWWSEFIDYDPGKTATSFEVANDNGSIVIVSGMKVWSLCEHHLLPFWCEVSIAYRPTDRALGLSKFGRLAHKHAHKLQIQERLCNDLAAEIVEATGTADVAVITRGEHLCMTCRGVRTPAMMTTTSFGGLFADDASARSEFLALAGI